MAGNKRPRQRTPYPKARQAAEAAAARERARRRRLAAAIAAGVVVLGVAIFLIVTGGEDDGTEVSTTPTTSATTAAQASAAGKPCVAVSDQLPQGAPEVPVREGPPPAQLVTQDLTVGAGATVAPGATVTVNYIGVACSTGKVFDSSYSRNQPVSFPLGNVIKGWQDGIPGMKVGGRRLLGIPPDQAYASRGSPPLIGPDETLWFVVEVLETK